MSKKGENRDISVSRFDKAGCCVEFTNGRCTISDAKTGNTILTGTMRKNLYFLDNVTHDAPQDVPIVEWVRSARSTASTGPIVTVRITLISNPDTRIDGALMAASIMSCVPLRHQARPNMVCAHYVVCINMWTPALCDTSLLSSLPPSPLLSKPPSPLTPR